MNGMTIKADRKLLANLKTLGPKIEKDITRKALRAAAKDVLKVLKPMLPKRTGATRKLARVRAMKYKRGRVGISVLLSAKAAGADTFHARFVDLGTKRIKARKNVRRAFDQTAGSAEETIRSTIKAGIAGAVR